MITVVITSTNRGHFLRTALASVARQTALGQVAEIIVSENSGNDATRAVCEEFKDLAIRYAFRNPPVPAIQHLPVLLAEIGTDLLAILHDDDWWHPVHLASALEGFRAHPEAASYWAAYYSVYGENSMPTVFPSSVWAAGGCQPLTETWKLSEKQVLLACLPQTPVHYSTLVARKDALAESCQTYIRQNNLHDNDRTLVAELARLAPVLFQPVPETFIRMHPQQDSVVMHSAQREEHVGATTDYILGKLRGLGVNVRDEWEALIQNCPAPFRKSVCGGFILSAIRTLKRNDALPPSLGRYLIRQTPKRIAVRVAKRLGLS